MGAAVEAGRFGSGRVVPRIEDEALLEGRGRFTDDVPAEGAAHIAFLRSPYAHARIVSIDIEPALAMPGVLAVHTGSELATAGVKPISAADIAGLFKRPDGKPTASPARRALAHLRVRFVGEPVAAVVAESRAAARDACEAIVVEYEELPPVVDPVAATKPGSATIVPEAPDNISCEARYGDAAATARAFEQAAHTVALDLVNQRLAPSALEPRSVLAWTEGERLLMRLSTQMPTGVMNSLVDALGLPKGSVRVVVGDVGGGFGSKTGIYPEDITIAYATRSLGRPVRWQAERGEDLVAAVHGRDLVSRAEMALDANGKVLGLRLHSLANVGAYATGTGMIIQLLIGPWVQTSIYDIRTMDLHFQAVLTNQAPTGAYRGAGRPEAIYVIERLFDAAAREMKLDPAELRRRNLVQPEQMPYTNAMGQVYDSGRFEQILVGGLRLAEWSGYEARRNQSRARGRLRGRGLASFLEWTGGNVFEERVTVTVSGDGTIEIFSATQAMGQGIATSLAQLAVDVFDVPIEQIRIQLGDTDRGQGFGSAGSRSLFTGGNSVKVAAERTVVKGTDLAAEALEAAPGDIEYRAGRFAVKGTDVGIGIFELAARQPQARFEVDSTSAAGGPTWPNACHVCEVEIDPDTGDVQVVAYSSMNDIGRVVSPQIAQGQVDGGAVQGLGQALCEAVAYDRGSGQVLTGSFMDYAMPRAVHAPPFRTEFDTSIPCTTNALGVKGVGELGTIGATPAVVNAVVDALDRAGLGRDAERLQMPLTSEKIWRALHLKDFGPAVR